MIPTNITTELAGLQAQTAAAAPLASASHATVAALQLNAGKLVNDIQTALAAASTLDSWAAPIDPGAIVSGFAGVVTASQDQSSLSLMRGLVGRATSNLDQI